MVYYNPILSSHVAVIFGREYVIDINSRFMVMQIKVMQETFGGIKGEVGSRKSKTRQYYGQKKGAKETNNGG